MKIIFKTLALIAFVFVANVQAASDLSRTPDRKSDEGGGPYKRLIIRGATVIDGTGAPPIGPMDIVVEGNRIVDMIRVGMPFTNIDESRRPKGATQEIDAQGAYVIPGLIDTHVHGHNHPYRPGVTLEYVYKLWLAHGITTVRGVVLDHSIERSLVEKSRSKRNEIVAPRIVSYHWAGSGKKWRGRKILTQDDAREWVRYAKAQGVDGIKIADAMRFSPTILSAILDEAKKQRIGSTAHLGQMTVSETNALDAARLGLGGMTHFYGLFESMYNSHDIQPFPPDYNYSNEQDRFGQVARQWRLVEPGGEKWNALLNEFLERDFYINPTLVIYSAGRDLMRAMNADWHQQYTLPPLWQYFGASRTSHGSYWYDWTTADEVAWKKFYQVWMQFLNEYKNRGGKVTVGSDAGSIYQLYGFATIQELEMLQEAGFTPLEVVRSATMYGAMELNKASGKPIETGVLRPGMLADMLIVEENPLKNFKVLYGTGALKLNDATGEVDRVGGVKYTIKDGIVYDAKKLLREVADLVAEKKAKNKEISQE